MAKARFSTLDRFGAETYTRIGVSDSATNPQIQAITDALDAILLGADVRAVVETETVVDAGNPGPAADQDADTLQAWQLIFYNTTEMLVEQLIIGCADWSLLEPDRFDLDLSTEPGLTLRDALLTAYRFPDGSQAEGILDDRARAVDLRSDTLQDLEVISVPPRPIVTATIYGSNLVQGVGSGGAVPVSFNAVLTDPDGITDIDNDRIIIPRDGEYIVHGRVRWTLNTTGRRAIFIHFNGDFQAGKTDLPVTDALHHQEITQKFSLEAGDIIKLYAQWSGTGSIDISGPASNPYYVSLSVIGF